MAGDVRAKTEVMVDVVIAVEIAEMRALALLHKDRIRIIGTVVARNPQRDALEVAFV